MTEQMHLLDLDSLSRLPAGARDEILNGQSRMLGSPAAAAVSGRRAIELLVWSVVVAAGRTAETVEMNSRQILALPWFVDLVPTEIRQAMEDAVQRFSGVLHASTEEAPAERADSAWEALNVVVGWCVRHGDVGFEMPKAGVSVRHLPARERSWISELKPDLMRVRRLVIAERGANSRIVVGAPLHVRSGLDLTGVGEVGTGYLAAKLADNLGAKALLACGAGDIATAAGEAAHPYGAALRDSPPRVLVEVRAWSEPRVGLTVEPAHHGPPLLEAIRAEIAALTGRAPPRSGLQRKVLLQQLPSLEIALVERTQPYPADPRITTRVELWTPAPLRDAQVNLDTLPVLGARFATVFTLALHGVLAAEFDVPPPLTPTARDELAMPDQGALRQELDSIPNVPDLIHGELLRAFSGMSARPAEAAVSLRRALEFLSWDVAERAGHAHDAVGAPLGRTMRAAWFKEVVPAATRRLLAKVRAITNEVAHAGRDGEPGEATVLDHAQLLALVARVRSGFNTMLDVLRWFAASAPPKPVTKQLRVVLRDGSGSGWSSDLKRHLLAASTLVVSRRGRHHRVVICAPHHSWSGAGRICQPPRVGDVGAGFLAARIADALGATVVVASHPQGPDPNKREAADAEYQRTIADLRPTLVIEVHGMARDSSAFDVEVAAGRNGHGSASRLAQCLQTAAGNLASSLTPDGAIDRRAIELLLGLAIGNQDEDAIRFPGRGNYLVTRCGDMGVPAYQLETVPSLRSSAANPHLLSRLGQYFGLALARAIEQAHPEVFGGA